MLLTRLAISTILLSLTRADVQFTSPAAGSVVNGSSLTAEWKDSSIAPSISQFESFSLFLCAGGNSQSDYIALANLEPYSTFAAGNEWTGAISTGWGANNTNAYFLKIVGSACGGTVINYSSRFSISSMTGSFPQNVLGAIPVAGSVNFTKGPDTEENNVVASACTTYLNSTSAKTTGVSTSTMGGINPTTTTLSAVATSSAPARSNATVSLSSHALAGLIGGVIIGFAAIAILVILVFIKMRKRLLHTDKGPKPRTWDILRSRKARGQLRLSSTDAINELEPNAVCKELDGTAVAKELDADTIRTGRQEIVGTPVSELPARKSIYEMQG